YGAIRNAARLVKRDGLFVIAIYNSASGRWLNSQRWWKIKRIYNRAPRVGQRLMEVIYALYWSLGRLRSRQNPLRLARMYRQSRGMALWTDIVDWLGGYPYEFAPPDEIIEFCQQSSKMRLRKLVALGERDIGNNEFVFERS